MKQLLFLISFYLLFSHLYGQTSKTPAFVIPPIIKGELPEIQVKFLLITLNDSLSNYFDISELNTFRLIDSRLQGHPTTHEGLPGVRVASGSLGQGLSVAIGAAHSKKLNNDDKLIYSLHGDGELQEGQNWEAIMYASAKNVDNIIATIDVNGQQIDGSTSDVIDMGNIKSKFEAFGWIVCEIIKGNDIQSIIDGMSNAKSKTGNKKPVCVLLNTVMGNGVDFMMHTHEWHGKAPNDEQLEIALNQNPETIGDY